MASPSTFKGAEEMMRKLDKLIAFSPNEFGRAMFEEAKVEVKECQRVAPKESGDMAGEIHAEEPQREGRKITVIIATGQKSIDYALKQHEDPDLLHPHGGEWKFIENPLKASAPYMARRIAARIDLNRYE